MLNKDIKNLKEIEKKYDAFVIATGCGKPRECEVEGKEHIHQAIDIILAHNGCGNRKVVFGDNVLVIGCGNVSMDMIQLLYKNNVKNTTVLSRSGPYASAYTNSEIRKIFNLPNLKICMNQNQEKINMTKLIERRKKILEIKNCG
ncbi:NADPH-adrenodoxin reductase, partial [Conglomerata obtusa]